MYKVSVIMPIFNAEKYLENTLNSVINQTIGFENIELILVDDKSTDNSRSIVEEYSSKYSNIKPIFLEENSGCPGIPRNVGIKNATSDYIMFIDNDDEYLPEVCDKLYNTMILEDVDDVVCNALCIDFECSVSTAGQLWDVENSKGIMLDEEIIYFDNVYVWNCIFKKSIILDNNICFVDQAYEDAIFTLEYSMHSKKLVYLKDFIGYHHFLRNDSTSLASFNWESKVINSYELLAKLLENGCIKYDLNRFFKTKIQTSIFQTILLGNKDEMKDLLSMLRDFERKIKFSGKLPIIYQFINFLVLHGKIDVATHICLFISKVRRSDLILNVYRKFFFKST